jgi:hypothetical protein
MPVLAVSGPPPFDVEWAGAVTLTLVVAGALLAAMAVKASILWITRWASRRLLLPAVYLVGAAEAALALLLWQVRDWLFDYQWASLVFLAYVPAALALNRLLLRRLRPGEPAWPLWSKAWRTVLLAAIYPALQSFIVLVAFQSLLTLFAHLSG